MCVVSTATDQGRQFNTVLIANRYFHAPIISHFTHYVIIVNYGFKALSKKK